MTTALFATGRPLLMLKTLVKMRVRTVQARGLTSRINAMLGLKCFRSGAVTISGIELMHRIRKGQFDLTKLPLKDTAAPVVWNAVLSAS
ncbi:hypothetical protein [Paraburkholderia hospita]|jgi:hypothetical protein|uniref:hypothetical protein n=1 Tax=Paraburkholderia hospita TaxID=169430 RepID=UPI0039BDC9B8